ncbi:MAG: hypothetical protein HGA85_08590, partial [Nanoarchaeota archaeon]|nr:hypothetical protein [Nanoarchaeota archaeon]
MGNKTRIDLPEISLAEEFYPDVAYYEQAFLTHFNIRSMKRQDLISLDWTQVSALESMAPGMIGFKDYAYVPKNESLMHTLCERAESKPSSILLETADSLSNLIVEIISAATAHYVLNIREYKDFPIFKCKPASFGLALSVAEAGIRSSAILFSEG